MDISPSAAVFVTLLAGLSAYVLYQNKLKTEGFEVKIGEPIQQPIGLKQIKQPAPVSITDAAVQPMQPQGPLPGAPFGQIANSSPLPYKNPVMEKATLFQINSLLEDLRGFLGFDGKSLEERSDPTIQLPLTRAKGDFQRLTDEYHVLTVTPGLQSQLSQQDILSIRANLRYLQRESRSLTASGAVEGFEDAGPRATKDELNELVIKIYAEMQRLSASGTSDPVIQARVTALTNMRLDVQSILQKLDSGDMKPADIPIYKSDIQKLLPLLPNVNDPLPTIIKKAGLSPALANMLPVKAGSKESDYLAQNQEVFMSAIDRLAKGLSWSVSLEYTSENKAAAGGAGRGNLDTNLYNIHDESLFSTGFPSDSELTTTSNPIGTKFKPTNGSGATNYPISLEEQRLAALEVSKGTEVGHFDWKQRAKDIRESIRNRGLNPTDFGCLTPAQESNVSPSFSWRGYCKMVCNRLTTTMDPGLPETCGCPPQGWMGWTK
jgi:hypothetical protein